MFLLLFNFLYQFLKHIHYKPLLVESYILNNCLLYIFSWTTFVKTKKYEYTGSINNTKLHKTYKNHQIL